MGDFSLSLRKSSNSNIFSARGTILQKGLKRQKLRRAETIDVQEVLDALEALNCPVNHWYNIIVYMMVLKLDSESLKD